MGFTSSRRALMTGRSLGVVLLAGLMCRPAATLIAVCRPHIGGPRSRRRCWRRPRHVPWAAAVSGPLRLVPRARGDGHGERTEGLSRAPRDFTNAEWRRSTSPRRVFFAIREGLARHADAAVEKPERTGRLEPDGVRHVARRRARDDRGAPMHELSVALSLVDAACEKGGGSWATSASRRCTCALAPLSGVVKDALSFCFEAAARRNVRSKARASRSRTCRLTCSVPRCSAERQLASAQHLRCPVCDEPTPDVSAAASWS